MKNEIFALLGIGLAAFLSVCGEPVVENAKIDAEIQKAAAYFLNPKPGEDRRTGLALFVQAMIMAAPRTSYPGEFGAKLHEAKRNFDRGSYLDARGIALLKEAYLLTNAGRAYQFPQSVTSMEEALEYLRVNVDRAREELKLGKIDACVKTVLEITLLIVTPREAVSSTGSPGLA
jgi:hypothetical protein